MRKLIALLIVINIYNFVFAQEANYTPPSMKYARFTNFHDFLYRYAYYPNQFISDYQEANIDVTIRVCKDGKVCLIDLKGYNSELFREHLVREIMKTDEHWAPATLNGEAVDTLVYQKIMYTLYETQNYLLDSTVVEKGARLARIDPLSDGYTTSGIFVGNSASYSNNKAYLNLNGDAISFEEFILLRRPGYDEFINGEKFMADSNYVEAIRHYMLAEQKEFYPTILFLNRAIAFFMVNKPVLGCRDLKRIYGFKPELDAIFEENCTFEKVVEKPLVKGNF